MGQSGAWRLWSVVREMAAAAGPPEVRTIVSRSVRAQNIVPRLQHGRYTGHGPTRVSQIPDSLLRERDKTAKWNGIPHLVQKLYTNSQPNNEGLLLCHGILKEIAPLLSMEAMAFVTEDGKGAQESKFPNTHVFDLFGGVDLLVEILMRPTLAPQKKKQKMNEDLIKDCLSILYNTCICTDGVTKRLSERNDFVLFLFTLMTNKKTFLQTATLIEDILGVKKEMIQLEDIPNLANLVASFDQQQLANFCRILSVTISELDTGNDDKHTLLAKNAQQKKSAGPSRAEINQVTLLNIPGFIERLCKLATRKVSETTGTSNFLQELEEWYAWLDNALVLDALMHMATEEPDQSSSTESADESVLAASQLRSRLPQSMKIMHEIMYKVEVLYVLCVLLMGRQRNQVHKMLAEFRLIPGLNNLFDKLIWRKHSTNHVLHGQNQICDCSPEISLKIQFLRLLQSFSDHHENRYLLLNSQELNELGAISLKANIPEVEAVVNTDRTLICDGKKGLLTRLLQVMKKEPAESSFRFWQARAVESFLRGVTSYADQMFLLKRGLLEFQIFLNQINSSLVDSNMLVRCIVLSLDRFESQTDAVKVAEVISQCCLLSYISRVENRLSFLFRLINIIQVQTLTQENVSCLNTSLVILMLARRKGKLPFYLNALREKEHCEKYPGFLLNNFHSLLRFWQEHYLNKDKDSTCLENSSCISFSYWKETVSLLLCPDQTSPCAIISYIDEVYMNIDKDFTED
ncbi:short transient receptor potential channel 4-associated protein-like isoform X2 [Chiloscyllium plagiosum]|uniref:short transient receptor potential channel 4-associated protein-like isoform X2 n=1 Tax=Chiloscyllium plagiosum TaxID=36176 RepID=UPI001CB80405|nr:short transient receptor potential channel 4-associated protein-like isoform X2 [Chiloscyllium plagiosum]